ncbi:MAG: hypothetical protein IPJ65_15170 [Archangiaceae bacterium]|nr:hypothetical protein [Archangiaceae bacterium]
MSVLARVLAVLEPLEGWELVSLELPSPATLVARWRHAQGAHIDGTYDAAPGASGLLRFPHFQVRYTGQAEASLRGEVAQLLQETGAALEREWQHDFARTLSSSPLREGEGLLRGWSLRRFTEPRLDLERHPDSAEPTVVLGRPDGSTVTLEAAPSESRPSPTFTLSGASARSVSASPDGASDARGEVGANLGTDAADSALQAMRGPLRLRPAASAQGEQPGLVSIAAAMSAVSPRVSALQGATFETSALNLTLFVPFWAGVKPAMRWVTTPLERDRFVAWARGCGLVAVPGTHGLRDGSQLVYVARDPQLAEDIAAVDTAVLEKSMRREPSADAQRKLGLLLGFPRCCVDAFIAVLERGIDRAADGKPASEYFVCAQAAAKASRRFHPWLNDLSPRRPLRLIHFFPCRYDCEAALEYAGRVHGAMLRLTPRALPALEALRGRAVVGRDGSFGDVPPGVERLELEFAAQAQPVIGSAQRSP